jgi:hypothetical protein
MPLPISLPPPSTIERNRPMLVDHIRRRALARLYERHEAIADLILSLEEYQRSRQTHKADLIDFSAARKKWSSNSALSRI